MCNILGISDNSHDVSLEERLFKLEDVGNLFWVGVGDVYIRGAKRHVGPSMSRWMAPGTIGVVVGVGEQGPNAATVAILNAFFHGKRFVVTNPVIYV